MPEQKIGEDVQEKLQEMQILEQGMQNISMQKRAFQGEFNETETALKEVNKTKENVFKIVGQIMLKSEKEEVVKELEEKKKLLELRLKTLEDQEKQFTKNLEKTRQEIVGKIK